MPFFKRNFFLNAVLLVTIIGGSVFMNGTGREVKANIRKRSAQRKIPIRQMISSFFTDTTVLLIKQRRNFFEVGIGITGKEKPQLLIKYVSHCSVHLCKKQQN